MADVAHTMPASIEFKDGSTFGFVHPGLHVTSFPSGRVLTRDWQTYNLRQYKIDPGLFISSDDTLEEWGAFWHQIRGGAAPGFIMEPVSGTHRDIICGGLADGSKTTFALPVYNPSSVTAFIDTAPTTSYTLHSAANLLSDAYASVSDASNFTATNASAATAEGVAMDGLACVKVTPAGGANPSLLTDARTTGFSASQDYTGLAWVLCTNSSAQNYRVVVAWYNGSDVWIDNSIGSNVSVAASDGWTPVTVSDTSPANTARAEIYIQRNDTAGTDPFFVDGFGIAPGDYDRWHLPSQSPGVIECSSAPASGARLYATATGQRITRCLFESSTSWSLTSPGHAALRSINATEWVEF